LVGWKARETERKDGRPPNLPPLPAYRYYVIVNEYAVAAYRFTSLLKFEDLLWNAHLDYPQIPSLAINYLRKSLHHGCCKSKLVTT
jgi:hypothetical protein